LSVLGVRFVTYINEGHGRNNTSTDKLSTPTWRLGFV